jgi:hypothetical protein
MVCLPGRAVQWSNTSSARIHPWGVWDGVWLIMGTLPQTVVAAAGQTIFPEFVGPGVTVGSAGKPD